MDTNEIIKHIDNLFTEFKRDALSEIEEKIAMNISMYKSAIGIGDKWCCKNMEEVAAKVFGVNKRTTKDFTFQNRLAITGHHIAYCPFCGIKL